MTITPTHAPLNPQQPSKADKELLFKGVTCALIGLVIVLAPYIARSGDVRELMGQVAAVGLVCAGAGRGVHRAIRGAPGACRGTPPVSTRPALPAVALRPAQRTGLSATRHVRRAAGPRMAQGLALRPPPAEPTTCCGPGRTGRVWGKALQTLQSTGGRKRYWCWVMNKNGL